MRSTSRLGRTGIEVPTCGFGGIPIGRDHIDDEQAADILRRAIDSGLLLIDTFCNYGRSEIRIGMALKGRREQVTLVTKARSAYEPDAFEEMVELSLKNLDVECIDVLLLKNVDNDACVERVERLVGVVDKMREQGKIRFTGLSAHSPQHAKAALETGLLDVAEVPYNYANRGFESVLDLAAERELGVLTMKPLGGGRLFGEAEKGSPATLDTLVDALSFARSHPAQPVLIPGIGTHAELDRYLEAIPKLRELNAEEKEALAQSALELGEHFCRGCGYCAAVCPAELPIDKILPLADRAQHVRTDNTYKALLKKEFATLDVDLESCQQCRKCVDECPFDLAVPERLQEAFELLRPKQRGTAK